MLKRTQVPAYIAPSRPRMAFVDYILCALYLILCRKQHSTLSA